MQQFWLELFHKVCPHFTPSLLHQSCRVNFQKFRGHRLVQCVSKEVCLWPLSFFRIFFASHPLRLSPAFFLGMWKNKLSDPMQLSGPRMVNGRWSQNWLVGTVWLARGWAVNGYSLWSCLNVMFLTWYHVRHLIRVECGMCGFIFATAWCVAYVCLVQGHGISLGMETYILVYHIDCGKQGCAMTLSKQFCTINTVRLTVRTVRMTVFQKWRCLLSRRSRGLYRFTVIAQPWW